MGVANEFEIGQRVKQFDIDDDEWAYGTIDNIGNMGIEIMWDDLLETCVHEKDEWDSIIILNI